MQNNIRASCSRKNCAKEGKNGEKTNSNNRLPGLLNDLAQSYPVCPERQEILTSDGILQQNNDLVYAVRHFLSFFCCYSQKQYV